MKVTKITKLFLRKFGYDVLKYDPFTHPHARRIHLIFSYGINKVLDIGANTGQFGLQLRELGYTGEIISFEPLSSAFNILKQNSHSDPNWQIYNYAIGNSNGSIKINIAGNSQSSSINNMLDTHLKAAPESKYIGQEKVDIHCLDTLFPEIYRPNDNIYLKIDTQGYEKNVIEGAAQSLPLIQTIQLEMSLVPLYENEMEFVQMYYLLYNKGYRLVSIEPGFVDRKSGQLLQIDGIFQRFF